MTSITSWTRLEPRTRGDDIQVGLQARVHDPLWFLARQLQLGELRGEYAGTPVQVTLDVECSLLNRYHPGALASPGSPAVSSETIDVATTPLEVLVEREPVALGSAALPRLAADIGLHFLQRLSAAGLGQYRAAFAAAYPLPRPTPSQRQQLD